MESALSGRYDIMHVMHQLFDRENFGPAVFRLQDNDKFIYCTYECGCEEDWQPFALNSLIEEKGEVSIGRGMSNNLVCKVDRMVSRKHGVLHFDKSGGLVYSDMSSNGTIVANALGFDITSKGDDALVFPSGYNGKRDSAHLLFGEATAVRFGELPAEGINVPKKFLEAPVPHYRLELTLERKQAG